MTATMEVFASYTDDCCSHSSPQLPLSHRLSAQKAFTATGRPCRVPGKERAIWVLSKSFSRSLPEARPL